MRSALLGVVALAFASTASHGRLSVVQGPIEAEVVRVVDGDTIDLKVMAWPDQATWATIRVRGIDTPEIRGQCEQERAMAQAAKRFVQSLSDQQDSKVRVTLVGCGASEGGGFGRCLANVYFGGVSLEKALIERGLARPNHGEARSGWCGAQ